MGCLLLPSPHARSPQDPPIYVSGSGIPELHGPWEATAERDWFGGGFTIYKLRGKLGKLMRWKSDVKGGVEQWRLYSADGYQRYVCTRVSATVPTSGWKQCSKGSKYGGKLPCPKFALQDCDDDDDDDDDDDGGDRETMTSAPVRPVRRTSRSKTRRNSVSA